VLGEKDGVRGLGGLFPMTEPVPLDEVCRRKLAGAEHAVLGEIRAFMQRSIGRLTSEWQDGMPGGPFTPEAVAAHAAAIAAGRAFVPFLVHPRRDPGPVQAEPR